MRYEPRESAKERQRKAKQRLLDKVAVLESWFLDGVPEGAFCPKRMGKFLEWEDPDLEVEVLREGKKAAVEGVYRVSAVTADRKDNEHLKARASELMGQLGKPKKQSSARAEFAKVKAERDLALRQVQGITNDYIVLRARLAEFEKKSKMDDNKINNLREEKCELTKKLAKVAPLHVSRQEITGDE